MERGLTKTIESMPARVVLEQSTPLREGRELLFRRRSVLKIDQVPQRNQWNAIKIDSNP